jgi:hypothetical protein
MAWGLQLCLDGHPAADGLVADVNGRGERGQSPCVGGAALVGRWIGAEVRGHQVAHQAPLACATQKYSVSIAATRPSHQPHTTVISCNGSAGRGMWRTFAQQALVSGRSWRGRGLWRGLGQDTSGDRACLPSCGVAYDVEIDHSAGVLALTQLPQIEPTHEAREAHWTRRRKRSRTLRTHCGGRGDGCVVR